MLRALDWLNRVELIDANDRSVWFDRFPALEHEDLSTAMYAVRQSDIFRGFDAFRAALWSIPVLSVLAWTWYLPGMRYVGMRVYAWVSSNRHELGCTSSCKL